MSDRTAVIDQQLAIDTCRAIAAKWATFHSVAPSAAEECAEALSRLPESRPTPGSETLNAWREVGEEMQRIIEHVDKSDLLPDWFEIRLADLLKLAAPASVGVGTPPQEDK